MFLFHQNLTLRVSLMCVACALLFELFVFSLVISVVFFACCGQCLFPCVVSAPVWGLLGLTLSQTTCLSEMQQN